MKNLELSKSVLTILGSLCLSLVIVASSFAVPVPGGTLNPRNIPKYVSPLVIPPEMPKVNGGYDIEVVPHNQQILPPIANDGTLLNATPVWTYGTTGIGNEYTRNYPAFTIEVQKDVNTHVYWRNNLVDTSGNPLPHLLPVDRSLHWANPELLPCMVGGAHTDCRPADSNGLILQQPYTGPVPIITHVHGAHTGPESDGYPEAWYLPPGVDSNVYATHGKLANQYGQDNTYEGYASFNYPNDQNSTTLWYHDHTLGMTRLNVYAGPAGFWLIRDPNAPGGETGLSALDASPQHLAQQLPGPRPVLDTVPTDHLSYREIPIVIQDRSFNHDPLTGATSLFYPDNRAFFEGLTQAQQLKIPFVGDPLGSDIAAIWNPEAFFNVMVVNGVSWPFLSVEPERYRFRLLNGCNSRFLNLNLVALDKRGKTLGEVPFYLIGNDQGLAPEVTRIVTNQAIPLTPGAPEPPLPATFPAPGSANALLMGLAERADVIVDFSKLPVGTVKVRMLNTAPDAPFGGWPDIPADPGTTGQVMEFVLVPDNPNTVDNSTAPQDLVLIDNTNTNTSTNTQHLALIEEESTMVCVSVNPAGKVKYLPVATPFEPLDPMNECFAAGGVPFAPKAAVLGTVEDSQFEEGFKEGVPQLWSSPIRTNPALNSTETWEIWNFTMDAHPIHLHLVHFQVINRQPFIAGVDPNTGTLEGALPARGPEPWEVGPKDTAIMYPGEVTRVKATFDIAGLYVWHCHIVEHEDNEMMVPYCVGDKTANGCANL